MHHLSSETIRFLSSSQVISSAVSVIKELVENALDANANSIEIKLVHIATKSAADEVSTLYVLDSKGYIVSKKLSHLGHGTTVTVFNLFKNLPVRKQYYSTTNKCKAELKKIKDLIMAYGIIKPDLRIVLVHNKVVIWQKNKVLDHKMALMSVFGTSVVRSMVHFKHQCDDPEIIINGFLPVSEDSSSTFSSSCERSFIFINQRPVHQKEILKMVRSYCSQNMTSHCYPVFFMNINVPPATVDVNMTPDKTQVMLLNKESVLNAIESILKSLYPGKVSEETETVCVQSKEAEINSYVYAEENNAKHVLNSSNPKQNSCWQSEACLTDMVPDNGRTKNSSNDPLEALPSPAVPCTLIHNSKPDNGLTVYDSSLKEVDFDNQLQLGELTEYKKHTSYDGLETSDNDWTMGKAFKTSSGENIEPVKVFCKSGDINTSKLPKETDVTKSPENKSNNAVFKKHGSITAFDLMSHRVVKKPLSAVDIFTQEYRKPHLTESAVVGFNETDADIFELWKQLDKEEKLKYEEKAAEDLQRYNLLTAKAVGKSRETGQKLRLSSGQSTAQKVKQKTSLSNQQILDTMFKSQIEKRAPGSTVKTIQVPFSLNSLKQRSCRISRTDMSHAEDFCLVNKLNFPGAWVIASNRKIMLLNPYRVEEALLYKRLLDNHRIAAEVLDSPVVITPRLLGESDYFPTLLGMQKDNPMPNGQIYFSDPRLTANGFKIKITGSPDINKYIEIEGMASNLPFYGLSDLKEILNLVMNKNAKELCDCRPLKILHFLEGEAVRLARQLPLKLSKDDVFDAISRMKKHLGHETKGCVHGRPFFYHLTDIPEMSD
ncbi:PMS1 protein homolog 1 isoform X2 [Hyperolius riggenbachi]|uniref:PMS1 protein homolog 1 isoform X2 n=1 Tax=Hyperolius riggenbachi TaxID=752182 RepID=UPI0035A39D69